MDNMLAQPMPLRGGFETYDPRLDRVPEFDERSRNYPITALIEATQPQTRWWGHTVKLDQGREGACVGFAWSHELNADPVPIQGIDDAFAQRIYKRAQQLDEWAGEDYSGTSVLAGAKAVAELGHLIEYRWAFGIEDVILTLSHHGPVILGINWYSGMYRPDGNQYIRPTGQVLGGHAIMAIAYDHEAGEIWLLNSWGAGWGWGGLCRIRVSDLARLLQEQGDACVPVIRADGTLPADDDVVPEPVEPVNEPDIVIVGQAQDEEPARTEGPKTLDDIKSEPKPESSLSLGSLAPIKKKRKRRK